MKFKITKAEWDALSDAEKAQYTAKGDGYQLTIEGLPDIDGMQNKLNTLLDEAKAAKAAKTEAEKKAQEDADAAARLKGDVDTLEASWKAKLEAAEKAHKTALDASNRQLHQTLVTNEAQALATKLFGKNAGVLLNNVSSRLTMEADANGVYKTRVLDANGKPSAASLDDLAKEFSGNADYASFLVTTKATGPSGATKTAPTTPASKPNNGALDNLDIARQAIAGMGNSQ